VNPEVWSAQKWVRVVICFAERDFTYFDFGRYWISCRDDQTPTEHRNNLDFDGCLLSAGVSVQRIRVCVD